MRALGPPGQNFYNYIHELVQMSRKISNFSVVTFTYSIKGEDGDLLEQSDLPLEYIHGVDGKMWPKVEHALTGKAEGDVVEVSLRPEEGFGLPDPDLIITQHIDHVPPQFRMVGARPQFENDAGDVMEMLVTQVADGMVTIDGNHPFAGKTVTFVVKVIGIRSATPQEVAAREVLSSNGLPMQ